MLRIAFPFQKVSSIAITNGSASGEHFRRLGYLEPLVRVMEGQTQVTLTDNNNNNNKVYFHYDHTDACKLYRWTARESFQFMYSRPWHQVVDFYSNLVKGNLSLLDLFGTENHFVHDDNNYEDDDNNRSPEVSKLDTPGEVVPKGVTKSGRWARATFKIVLSYHGGSFDGWQKQPGLNTVQGLVERSLGRFVDEKKAQLLKDKCKALEGCAVVAGRTDKGVSALCQVCSFYTWREDVKPLDIEDAINNSAPGKIRVVAISKVSRVFHPNFLAKWRRYLYIFPLNAGENRDQRFDSEEDIETFNSIQKFCEPREGYAELTIDEDGDNLTVTDGVDKLEGAIKPKSFSVHRVNQLLRQLEGKLLSYKMFARDTKASRNIGPPTECFIYHARAKEVRLPPSEQEARRSIMCIELIANRFLRKMVRVLVATSVREAAAGAEDDALLKLMDATCRRATAPPAPPDGLCLVDVGYTEFDREKCIIK